MMEPRLENRLTALARSLRRARLFRALAICWGVAAVFGLLLLALKLFIWPLPVVAGLVMAIIAAVRFRREPVDFREVIREIEPQQPEVGHLLSAASEQAPANESGAFSFLQWRVIDEALSHPRHAEWRKDLQRRLLVAQLSQTVTFVGLVLVAVALDRHLASGASPFQSLSPDAITVTPGDTNMERGTGLVVAAQYGGVVPPEATLVLNSAGGRESRIPMARRLADPIFGASIPEIREAGFYHIEYRGKRTRDFQINVFDYPALVRADAALQYPAYTGLTNRTIPDTLRVSAVEGSRLTYALQLNKPVVRARLIGKGKLLALQTATNAVAVLPDFLLTNSARYALELVDSDGRSNKFPTDVFFQVLTNQRPIVKIVFPRGDPRVSRLQELQLQAEASDDFGVLKYGIGFGVAGEEPRFIELGQTVPANTKRQFDYMVSLEKLGVDVDQAVSYFAWADDFGPDGQPRRTFSDIFFADVRPFDEVFRADQSGGGGESAGQSGGGGNKRVKLVELEKQIVVATWNLEKDGATPGSHP